MMQAPFFLGNHAPLLQNLLIISAQAVDAFDDNSIPAFYFADHALIVPPLKNLSGLLIDKNLLLTDAEFLQRDQLPLRMLLLG